MKKFWVGAGIVILLVASLCLRADAPAAKLHGEHLITPKELVKLLKSGASPKPVLLQVGVHSLYVQGHIPGAIYAGPASNKDGIANLRSHVALLPRNTFIVIYCGCCPWTYCPNFRPAAAELHKLGFTHVSILHLPTTFQHDWVEQGYPVVTGE
jgi:thiosulfate/3-mercaptopyruvate sulfurtransferase